MTPADPLTHHGPRLAQIRLVALDVDGVLTDGGVVYVGDQELQRFDVKDGAGLAWLRKSGVQLAWITGRGCDATQRRARELGVQHLRVRERNKAEALEAIQQELGLTVDQTLAMGDDLPDLAMATRAGLFCAPADGVAEVRERADLVTFKPGGRGAVREVCELLLRAQGHWDGLVAGAAG